MTVTWTTWVPTPSEVQFGLQLWGSLPLQAQGTFSPFVDGGILRMKLYIHQVTLQGLLPGVQYDERGPGPRCYGGNGKRSGMWARSCYWQVAQVGWYPFCLSASLLYKTLG